MRKNNWEVWHDTTWTEFELHSAVFGNLRKALYPNYLVRGNFRFITKEGITLIPDISIFKKTKGTPAELKLIVEIKRPQSSTSGENTRNQRNKYKLLDVPIFYVEGRSGLHIILDEVTEFLGEPSNDL